MLLTNFALFSAFVEHISMSYAFYSMRIDAL